MRVVTSLELALDAKARSLDALRLAEIVVSEDLLEASVDFASVLGCAVSVALNEPEADVEELSDGLLVAVLLRLASVAMEPEEFEVEPEVLRSVLELSEPEPLAEPLNEVEPDAEVEELGDWVFEAEVLSRLVSLASEPEVAEPDDERSVLELSAPEPLAEPLTEPDPERDEDEVELGVVLEVLGVDVLLLARLESVLPAEPDEPVPLTDEELDGLLLVEDDKPLAERD